MSQVRALLEEQKLRLELADAVTAARERYVEHALLEEQKLHKELTDAVADTLERCGISSTSPGLANLEDAERR